MAYELRKALLSHLDSIKPTTIKFFTKDPGFDMKLEADSLRGPQSLRVKKKGALFAWAAAAHVPHGISDHYDHHFDV